MVETEDEAFKQALDDFLKFVLTSNLSPSVIDESISNSLNEFLMNNPKSKILRSESAISLYEIKDALANIETMISKSGNVQEKLDFLSAKYKEIKVLNLEKAKDKESKVLNPDQAEALISFCLSKYDVSIKRFTDAFFSETAMSELAKKGSADIQSAMDAKLQASYRERAKTVEHNDVGTETGSEEKKEGGGGAQILAQEAQNNNQNPDNNSNLGAENLENNLDSENLENNLGDKNPVVVNIEKAEQNLGDNLGAVNSENNSIPNLGGGHSLEEQVESGTTTTSLGETILNKLNEKYKDKKWDWDEGFVKYLENIDGVHQKALTQSAVVTSYTEDQKNSIAKYIASDCYDSISKLEGHYSAIVQANNLFSIIQENYNDICSNPNLTSIESNSTSDLG